mmetsp:Transcript_145337/g.464457  ORF Transcript_145337/g.464457 Transcript_145337/m.464457 type:complete len:166 (+) Transcript_145337:889-1386(+)
MDAVLADLWGRSRGSHQAWLPSALAASAALGACAGALANGVGSSAGAGSLEGFEGPFTGMGITGFNDLASAKGLTPAACAERCRGEPACRSFEVGAREAVQGECWLSTATRDSAGSAYTTWKLYDYYELRGTSTTALMVVSSSTGRYGVGSAFLFLICLVVISRA